MLCTQTRRFSSKPTWTLLPHAAQPYALRPQISWTQLDLFQHIHNIVIPSSDICMIRRVTDTWCHDTAIICSSSSALNVTLSTAVSARVSTHLADSSSIIYIKRCDLHIGQSFWIYFSVCNLIEEIDACGRVCRSVNVSSYSLSLTSWWQAVWLDHNQSFSTQTENKWNVLATCGVSAWSESRRCWDLSFYLPFV